MDREHSGTNATEQDAPALTHFGDEPNTTDARDHTPTETASNADSVSVCSESITEELKQFNHVSAELDKSYQGLEIQVAELNRELARSRIERARDTQERNRTIQHHLQEIQEKDRQIDRLNALVSILPSAIVILDKSSIVRDVNTKATELLGESLVGLSWSGIVARVAIPEVRSGFELRLRDGRILSLVSRDLGSEGERVIFINEVTSIHETQERVNRDKRLAALGEMAASLAHQIRTPLSSSMLYMSQLSLSKLPQADRETMAHKVQDRLSHMSSLIDSMLSFVRGAKPQTRALSVSGLIEKAEQLTKVAANQAGASIKFSEVDPGLLIHGDSEVLAGAIVNLVMNAIQMHPDKPWVSVVTEATSDNHLQIKVSDNGPGVSKQHIEKIFDPFFTTRVQGTGLGLAVVAMTVSAHDGDVSVQNRDTGGAEFTIRLPLLNTVGAIGHSARSSHLSSRLGKEVA